MNIYTLYMKLPFVAYGRCNDFNIYGRFISKDSFGLLLPKHSLPVCSCKEISYGVFATKSNDHIFICAG